MATYAVGDIQGCSDAFEQLLQEIAFNPAHDRLWLVGDLVNRGPDSLAVLRRVRDLGDRATVVLGNHDLHLLAVAAGARGLGANDTLDEVLEAPDADALLAWLRARPLAHLETIALGPVLMVHAGVPPSWDAHETVARAREVERALAAHDWREFLGAMYGDAPRAWNERLEGVERLRVIVNALTRMRFCNAAGEMDLKTKEGAAAAPPGYAPWFDAPGRAARTATIVFGHWSTMGLVERRDVIGLDTGCVWGGALTAIRLEDRRLWQLPCREYRRPG